MKMRKYWASAALLLATSWGGAQAADLPVFKGPPPIPAPILFTWTGFYVGLNGGFAFGGDDVVGLRLTPPANGPQLANYGKLELSGGFGGGQVGYNWQLGALVFGVEADIQGAGIDDTVTADRLAFGFLPTTARSRSRVNFFGTARGRVGWAWDRLLIYGTGGFAYGGVDYRVEVEAPGVGLTSVLSKDDVRTGWAGGGGVEWAFAPNWTAKVEYQYINLGRDTISGPLRFRGAPIRDFRISTQETPDFHTVRVGINYKFW